MLIMYNYVGWSVFGEPCNISILSPSKNRSAWRFGINNWDDHQLSLNPNRKPRVQHFHIWGPVWSVFPWAIFHMAFSGISRGRPTYTSNHLGDVFVVQELNRVAPGKGSIKGISPAKMGGWSLKKPRWGARNTWNIYVQRKDGNPLNFPVPHLFVQPYLGWVTNTFGMGWKQQPGRKSGHFEFFRTFLDQRIWSLIVFGIHSCQTIHFRFWDTSVLSFSTFIDIVCAKNDE